MLNNPNWDRQQTTADPFERSTLIAWLAGKPAHLEYCFYNSGECMLQQYFSAQGFRQVSMGREGFWHEGGHSYLPDGFDAIAKAEPHTFGAALMRAVAG